MTHNHPANRGYPRNDPRYDGGGFSRWDLQTAIDGDVAEMRAVTERHTYVVRRPVDGWTVSVDAVSGVSNPSSDPHGDPGLYREAIGEAAEVIRREVAAGTRDPRDAQSDAEVTPEALVRLAPIAGFAYERQARGR